MRPIYLVLAIFIWTLFGGVLATVLTHRIVKRQEQIIKQIAKNKVQVPTPNDIASIIIVDNLPPHLTDTICKCIASRVGFMLRSEYISILLEHEVIAQHDIWAPCIDNNGGLIYRRLSLSISPSSRQIPVTELWSHGYLQYAATSPTIRLNTATIEDYTIDTLAIALKKLERSDIIIPAEDVNNSTDIQDTSLLVRPLPSDIADAIDYRWTKYAGAAGGARIPLWFTVRNHPP